jgi:hypothetical protein
MDRLRVTPNRTGVWPCIAAISCVALDSGVPLTGSSPKLWPNGRVSSERWTSSQVARELDGGLHRPYVFLGDDGVGHARFSTSAAPSHGLTSRLMSAAPPLPAPTRRAAPDHGT